MWRVSFPFMKIASCCVLVLTFFFHFSVATDAAAVTDALSSFDHLCMIHLVDWQKCLFQSCFSLRHLAIQSLLDVKCLNLFTSTFQYVVYDCHQEGKKERERKKKKKEWEIGGRRENKPLKLHSSQNGLHRHCLVVSRAKFRKKKSAIFSQSAHKRSKKDIALNKKDEHNYPFVVSFDH